MTTMLRLAASLLVLAFATAAAAQAPAPQQQAAPRPAEYRDVGRLISSRQFGYGYAYAPAIVREGGLYHMLFCTMGRMTFWDYIRYSVSTDGQTWSDPVLVMEGKDEVGERAACDPSVVRYRAPGDERPYWYLFYSGNAVDVQTLMFVARAEAIGGPYAKWTRRGTWEVDAVDPQVIIGPTNPKPEKSPFYGAGQQSVVVEGGRLVSWYTDDTTCGAAACVKIFRSATRDPTRWPRGVETNVAGTPSVDVKRDGAGGYVMIGVESQHTPGTTLSLRRSKDGLAWSAPETVCGAGCFPAFTHNPGISGTATGTMLRGPMLVVYGGPLDRDPSCGLCFGKWDLFGGRLRLPAP